MATNGAGELIRDVRELCGLKQYDLGLDPRTVSRWENEGFPTRPEPESLRVLKERLGILESDLADANAGRPPALDTFDLSHPHRSLLSVLRQRIKDPDPLEVIGPPDVLFDKIADCIEIGIESVSRKSVVRIDANELNPMSFDAVRVACAKAIGLSEHAQEDHLQFKREAKDSDWVLLLHGADVCCSFYYQKRGAKGVETDVSRWCSQLASLRVPCILFNTFPVKGFTKYSPGVPSQAEPYSLCYDRATHCDAWDSWCAKLSAVDRFGKLVSPSCHPLLDRSPGLLVFALKELKRGTTLAQIPDRVRRQHALLMSTVEGLVPEFLQKQFRSVMDSNPEPVAGTIEGDLALLIQNASLRALWERR